MARTSVVTGVFASPREAEEARSRLLAAGVPDRCIALSTDLSSDGLAAECPGQSYSNQPGQGPGDRYEDALVDSAHVGGCVIQVDLEAGKDRGSVEVILRECGGRQPAPPH